MHFFVSEICQCLQETQLSALDLVIHDGVNYRSLFRIFYQTCKIKHKQIL